MYTASASRDRDSLDILRGELALARERYFTGGCKTLRVGKREVIRGFEGKLQGKLSRRAFSGASPAHNVTGTGTLPRWRRPSTRRAATCW